MTEIIEVKNMEYVGKEIYTVNGQEMKLRTMVLKDLDAERWNSYAERTNTRMFILDTGRMPESYEEVKKWVNKLIKGKQKAPAATEAMQYA